MKFLSTKQRHIYGINPVMEALRAKRKFLSLEVQRGKERALSEIIDRARALSVKIQFMDANYFDKNLPKGHQGISAIIIDTRDSDLQRLLREITMGKEDPFFLVLDGIEDPRNFGALLRTAEGAGVHAVIHQPTRSAGFSGIASKASAGAIEHVNIIETANIKNVLHRMIDEGITLIAAEQSAKKTLWDVNLTVPLALIIGGEDRGLRQTVRSLCQHCISIPMAGNLGSLNVSVAAGILCFEVLRQRRLL